MSRLDMTLDRVTDIQVVY